jgi:hypothetical protein
MRRLLVVCVLVALTGCGQVFTTRDGVTPAEVSSDTDLSTTDQTVVTDASESSLRELLINSESLGPDWVSDFSSGTGESDDGTTAALYRCVGTMPPDALVSGPELSRENIAITSEITVGSSVADAVLQHRSVDSSAGRDCWRAFFTSSVAGGVDDPDNLSVQVIFDPPSDPADWGLSESAGTSLRVAPLAVLATLSSLDGSTQAVSAEIVLFSVQVRDIVAEAYLMITGASDPDAVNQASQALRDFVGRVQAVVTDPNWPR